MRRGRAPALAAAFLVAAVAAVPARARAAACGDPRDATGGPLPGGTDAADFGAIPETCAGTELALRVRGTALVSPDMPDYYGYVSGAAMLRLRHQLGHGGRAWFSVAIDAVTYRYVANAVIVGDGFAFGPPTVAFHRGFGDWARTAAHAYARALLPLDTARRTSVRTGLELGITMRRTLGPAERYGLQGGAALLAPLVVVDGQTHGTLEPVALVEGWLAARPRIVFFAGLGARVEATPAPAFLTLAPRVAARFASKDGLSFAALVEAPVAGGDRTNLVVGLFLAWAGVN